MNQDDKRRVENRLISWGWPAADTADLVNMFAQSIENFPGDRHWFFRGLLNECDPKQRTEMYNSLAPKFVRFKPLSLETYMAQIAEDAYRMVSHHVMRVQGRPQDAVIIESEAYVAANPDRATHVAVRLICRKCQKQAAFVGETLMAAMTKARKKGWVRDYENSEREICPKCPAVRPTRRNGWMN